LGGVFGMVTPIGREIGSAMAGVAVG